MEIAKIRLRKPRRVFSFVCGDIGVQRDDACIVQTDRGTEWGTCILPPEPCSPEMEKLCTMRVVRKANENDGKTFDILVHDERRAYSICLEKIRQRGLPMKLVDAEYTFDKRRVIFYFTAEDRVDFRELVRDLAHELRTRIELRHIQVRDEAKMVGGLGCCGLKLCCNTWLDEFKPISMRMAKRQNLSLNPSKISGQCGRLLCCLDYENECYESPRRKCKNAPPAPEPVPEEEFEGLDPIDEIEIGLDPPPDYDTEAEEPRIAGLDPSAPAKTAPPSSGDRRPRRRGRNRGRKPNSGGNSPAGGPRN
jgi:cell fate regulator YaaT (PSP1 superfamily)